MAFESPDSRWVYYLRRLGASPDLWKVPAEGGDESLAVERVTRRNFVVFEHGIYFMQSPAEDDPQGSFSIRFLDFKTGAVSTVTTLDPSIRPFMGFTVSPDERSILYATTKQVGADLMLVENFR